MKNKIGSFDEKRLEESKAKLSKHIDDEKRANSIMSRMEKQMKKHYSMTYICYNNLRKSEFHNFVSAKDNVKDINLNYLKLKVNDTYKKDE